MVMTIALSLATTAQAETPELVPAPVPRNLDIPKAQNTVPAPVKASEENPFSSVLEPLPQQSAPSQANATDNLPAPNAGKPVPKQDPRLTYPPSARGEDVPTPAQEEIIPAPSQLAPPSRPLPQDRTSTHSILEQGIPNASSLVGQAEEFNEIYYGTLFSIKNLDINRWSYVSQFKDQRTGEIQKVDLAGHSVAAALLVMCLPEKSPTERAQLLNEIVREIYSYYNPLIAKAESEVQLQKDPNRQMTQPQLTAETKASNPWITQAAAHAACKMGSTHTVQEIVAALWRAQNEMLSTLNLPDLPRNLVVTAILMNPLN